MTGVPEHAQADSPEAGGDVTIIIVESRESSRRREEADRKLKHVLIIQIHQIISQSHLQVNASLS